MYTLPLNSIDLWSANSIKIFNVLKYQILHTAIPYRRYIFIPFRLLID